MRDKIIHFYFGIYYELVWKVIKDRLPGIKPLIGKMLKDLEERNGR
ncbi:MAG: HepT-like ribonuclease domain-containing protein [bacterium JZ-2024 1]